MGYSLRRLDGGNITLREARDIARVRVDAFRTDKLQTALFPPEHRLDPPMIPDLADFEELKKKITFFKNKVNVMALDVLQSCISDPHTINYVLTENGTGTVVGVTEWHLPQYAPYNIGYLQLMWRKLYATVLKLYTYVYKWFHPVNDMSLLFDEFRAAATQSGLDEGKPHTLETLRSLNRKELEKIVYPKNLSYYLSVVCVRPDMQGHGLGKLLLQGSLKEVSRYATAPPGVNGPAKLLWQSVPTAQAFYTKLGFHAGPAVTSARGFPHAVFFANVG